MIQGWLVRCDPAAGRFEVELGTGGERRHDDGRVTVQASAFSEASASLSSLRADAHQRQPGAWTASSPAADVSTAVWSERDRTLWLVRDRTGRRPLFHTRVGSCVIASSDLRALLDEPGVSREPSAIAVAEWLVERPGPPEETLLRTIRRVPAGHVARITAEGETVARDWAPPERGTHAAAEAERFGPVLEAAIARVVDGPTGIFLSSGIDSSSVAAAAVRVSVERGLPLPLALCVDMPEESEVAHQRLVAGALGLTRVVRRFESTAETFAHSRAVAARSLWPVQTGWASIGENLLDAARSDGRVVILDGIGGDEMLDAGIAPARRFLRRGALRPLLDLIRAERHYSDTPAHSVLRVAIGRGRSRPPDPPPGWIADPSLRRELADRAAAPPKGDDLLDTFAAAGREAVDARGFEGGFRFAEPFFDPDVVELLCGLPEAVLVRGGEAKSPARHYLRARIPSFTERWPRPAAVSDLLADVVEHDHTVRFPRLEELGISAASGGVFHGELDAATKWGMLAIEGWLQRGKGQA